MKKLLTTALVLLTIASLGANVLLYMRYSSSRPILRMADGTVITRKEYQDNIDHQYGKQVLKKLTLQKIIRQAASKAGVEATEKDVDERLAMLERRSPKALAQVKQDPVAMARWREATLTQISLENLQIKDVKVSDAEAKAFFAKNRTLFAQPLQISTQMAIAENAVDAKRAANMMDEDTPMDVIARLPRIRVVGANGWNPDWNLFPKPALQQLTAAANRLTKGNVSVVRIDDVYFIMRHEERREAGVPSFEKMRDLAVRTARLSKAPETASKTVARLYREADIKFEVEKYAPYLSDTDREMREVDSAPDAKETKTASSPSSSAKSGKS